MSDRGGVFVGELTWSLATTGPDDTRAIAGAVSSLLTEGDVVALSGELGAGKTCFVQGAAAGLGVEARVTSPTFVLVRHYAGRLPMVHCDVYRLERLHDVEDLGDEVLAPDVVTFVEWGDTVAPLLPDDRLEVELALRSDLDADRTLTIRALGPRWEARATALAEACAPWS